MSVRKRKITWGKRSVVVAESDESPQWQLPVPSTKVVVYSLVASIEARTPNEWSHNLRVLMAGGGELYVYFGADGDERQQFLVQLYERMEAV